MGRYLLAELSRRAGRTLSTALGIALGVGLFIALSAAGVGFQEAARRPLAGVGADILLIRPAGEKESGAAAQTTRGVRLPFGVSTLTLGDAAKVHQIKDVDAVAGGLLLWDFGATSYQAVLGVDVNQPAVGPAKAREWVVAGRFLQANDTQLAVVDKHYAAFFSLKPGSPVSIGGEPFQVIGIVEAQEGSQAGVANFYIPLTDAQRLAHMNGDTINQIYVRVNHASSVEDVVQQSRAALGDVNATTEQSIVQVMGSIALVSQRFAGISSLVALLGGLVLTGLALSASVSERRREVGVMKAVGWTSSDVRRYFLVEGLVLSLGGAAAGIILGWLASLALGSIPLDLGGLNPNAPAGLAAAPAAQTVLGLPAQVTLPSIALALGLAALGGTIASALAARQSANLKPAEAFRQ